MCRKVFIFLFVMIFFILMFQLPDSFGQTPSALITDNDWIGSILSNASYSYSPLFIQSYPSWFNVYARPTNQNTYYLLPYNVSLSNLPFSAYYINRPFEYAWFHFYATSEPFLTNYPFTPR